MKMGRVRQKGFLRRRRKKNNMQKVVRTAPTQSGYWYTKERMKHLEELLNEGYKVVMCNKIGNDLEYIVEKEEE